MTENCSQNTFYIRLLCHVYAFYHGSSWRIDFYAAR